MVRRRSMAAVTAMLDSLSEQQQNEDEGAMMTIAAVGVLNSPKGKTHHSTINTAVAATTATSNPGSSSKGKDLDIPSVVTTVTSNGNSADDNYSSIYIPPQMNSSIIKDSTSSKSNNGSNKIDRTNSNSSMTSAAPTVSTPAAPPKRMGTRSSAISLVSNLVSKVSNSSILGGHRDKSKKKNLNGAQENIGDHRNSGDMEIITDSTILPEEVFFDI